MALEICFSKQVEYRQKSFLPHLVWDVLVLVQEHFELADADVQVSVGELVGNVETQWPKLSPLQCNSMEQTQRQEQRLEVCYLEKGGEERRREEKRQEEGRGEVVQNKIYP